MRREATRNHLTVMDTPRLSNSLGDRIRGLGQLIRHEGSHTGREEVAYGSQASLPALTTSSADEATDALREGGA